MRMNYRLDVFLLNTDSGDIFPYPNVLQTLHWFKKGAPPGIDGSACTA